MEMVTPEEVAQSVVRELVGSPTGRDVVSALDGAVLGPTFRGGYLREAALTRLRQLEEQHGKAVAFERLGPPRLTKLLFEGHLLERAFGTAAKVAEASPTSSPAQRRRHWRTTRGSASGSSRSGSGSCCRTASACCAGRPSRPRTPTTAGST